MNPIEIRKARGEDASRVVALLEQLGYDATPAETTRRIAALNDSIDTDCFVAVAEEGEIIACMQMILEIRLAEGRFAEIGSLVVADTMRGKQVGRRMVERAVDWAGEKGQVKLRVRCNAKRKGAHRFYRNLDFSEAKEQTVFERSKR